MVTLSGFPSITPLYADMVWPAVVLEQHLLSVIPITAGLVIEWLALWLGGFDLSWKKAAVVDIVMNTVSTTGGMILLPMLGLLWEIFPGVLLYKVFGLSTFNPGSWAATFAMAVFATAAIEAAVVNWGFKIQLDRRRFWILCGANSLSVAIAFASLWIHPTKL